MKSRLPRFRRAIAARTLVALGVAALSCAITERASAGGLYLMPRGAEAASRGGARVAGADDPQALWYNPAGLLSSGRQLLVDTTLPIVRTEFTRVLDNGTVEPTVSSTSAIPIPTIAYTDNFGLRDWGFGVALIVPPAFGGEWPTTVNGRPAPQRYSIIDARGSFIGSLALGAAYTPLPRLSLGLALYLTAAQVGATVAVSACDYAICSQPEAPEWEGRTRALLGPVYTATAVFGAGYALDKVKLGASLQLKTKISGEASFDVALPDQAVFDDVQLVNRSGKDDLKADMSVVLPMLLRAGVEVQPIKPLKVEVGGTWENWSSQSSIVVDPKDVIARNVPGIGDVRADKVVLARNMRDTWALNVGGQYDLTKLLNTDRAIYANAGFMYESSSFADRDLSVTTVDTQKTLLALGVSVEVARNVYIDASYGHIFMRNHNVKNSRVLLPAAIRPLPLDDDTDDYEPGDRPAIGNGRYVLEADFVALGVRWKLDAFRRRREPRPPETPPSASSSGAAPVPVIEPMPTTPATSP